MKLAFIFMFRLCLFMVDSDGHWTTDSMHKLNKNIENLNLFNIASIEFIHRKNSFLVPISPIQFLLKNGQREWMSQMLMGMEDCPNVIAPIIAAANLLCLCIRPIYSLIENVNGQSIWPTNCIAFDNDLNTKILFNELLLRKIPFCFSHPSQLARFVHFRPNPSRKLTQQLDRRQWPAARPNLPY